ncbi:glycosyltransferase family 4 protein [Rugamonas sp. A1-17]|nr:glycosyltransferase family 4 protein [Rugamonas sp. A1-17]
MKKIVMIGTQFGTMGGISSVVNVYRAAGLFEKFDIRYIATHGDGSAAGKLRIAALALAAYLKLLLLSRIALLHIHVSSRASFWRKLPFFALATLWRVPTILHIHSGAFDQFYARQGWLGQRLIRWTLDRATRVIVLSHSWRDWVGTVSANRHVVALYNPVAVPAWSAAQDPAVAADILMLGRLGRPKGTYDLLEAWQLARQAVPSVTLSLGGDGEREQVAQWAAAHQFGDHVRLLGWVTGDNKEHYFQSASIYALPSYSEGLPMSVLEAMARGLPVISTPVGGIPEAISHGVEGYLVAPGDVPALASHLAQLLAEPALRQRMGEAGRRKVQAVFSTEVILPRLESIYRELGCEPPQA